MGPASADRTHRSASTRSTTSQPQQTITPRRQPNPPTIHPNTDPTKPTTDPTFRYIKLSRLGPELSVESSVESNTIPPPGRANKGGGIGREHTARSGRVTSRQGYCTWQVLRGSWCHGAWGWGMRLCPRQCSENQLNRHATTMPPHPFSACAWRGVEFMQKFMASLRCTGRCLSHVNKRTSQCDRTHQQQSGCEGSELDPLTAPHQANERRTTHHVLHVRQLKGSKVTRVVALPERCRPGLCRHLPSFPGAANG